MSARYVKHDGLVWRVVSTLTLDDEPALELVRRQPGKGPAILVARERDCEAVTLERRRRFRDVNGVVEFDSRGNVTVRERGRRKRYTLTIKGLILLCARAEADRLRAEKAHRRRIRRRS